MKSVPDIIWNRMCHFIKKYEYWQAAVSSQEVKLCNQLQDCELLGEVSEGYPAAKWWSKQDGCKRGSECGYLHVMSENKTEANSEKFKCISCKHIWEDRSCVMEHFIGNMRMFFCLNCDDWVHDKQKVLEHGWTLFDEAGNLRMDL